MPKSINDAKLECIAEKVTKSELVKTDLANSIIMPGGWGNIDNSPQQNQDLNDKSEECFHDYIKHHDWKSDPEYLKRMRMTNY